MARGKLGRIAGIDPADEGVERVVHELLAEVAAHELGEARIGGALPASVKISRNRRSLAPKENSFVLSRAGGESGTACARPARTMKRFFAEMALMRSLAKPSSRMSEASAGSPSSNELGPRSISQPSHCSVPMAPPVRPDCSKTRTLWPCTANRWAAVRPVMPAPRMAMDFLGLISTW